MPQGSGIDRVRIFRVDQDLADLAGVFQPYGGPSLSSIRRLEHPRTLLDVAPHIRFAGSNINHIWISGGNGNGTDGRHRYLIEDWLPSASSVLRDPHATTYRTKIELLWLARNSGYR